MRRTQPAARRLCVWSCGKVLRAGSELRCTRIFTADDVQAFSKISGDTNPIHLNEAEAAAGMFKKPVVHGMLSASLFSGLLGSSLPGSVYVRQHLKFRAPIFVDSKVEVLVTMKSVKANGLSVWDTVVFTDGKSAVTGEAAVLLDTSAVNIEVS